MSSDAMHMLRKVMSLPGQQLNLPKVTEHEAGHTLMPEGPFKCLVTWRALKMAASR